MAETFFYYSRYIFNVWQKIGLLQKYKNQEASVSATNFRDTDSGHYMCVLSAATGG